VVSRHLDPERDLADMEQYPDVFVGFKFLADYYKVPISDKRHDPYWEYADKHRLLVLVHTWGGSDYNCLRHAEEVLERYPNLIFIAGHSFHGKWEGAVELAARYPNLYLELTAVLDDRGVLDYFVDKLGSERILFGTDLPWFATHHGIGAVMSADITDDDRRNILYRNGKKLLERFPWFEEFWNKYGGGAF
jgi:predicted TIM-barrel fold metal-dependent hydrolase